MSRASYRAHMAGVTTTSDAIYRRLIENATGFAIMLLGPDGAIETWNRGAERVFGYTPEEIIGRNFEILFTAEDPSKNIPQRELEDTRKIGRGEDTRWHVRKDGSPIFADGVTTSVVDDKNAVAGSSATSPNDSVPSSAWRRSSHSPIC